MAASDNLKSTLLLDEQNLQSDLLTAENRKELCDSRPRIKVVSKGFQNRDVSSKFKQETTTDPFYTRYYRSLEQLAKSAIWKKKLTMEKVAELSAL